MGIIAIDLWDKKVGIAHENSGFSFPRAIVKRSELISYLKKLEKEYSYDTIIVGLPYDLYGKELRQLEKTQKFIEKLRSIFSQKYIEGVDERFTTFEAERNAQKGEQIDDISASLILETYLQNKK